MLSTHGNLRALLLTALAVGAVSVDARPAAADAPPAIGVATQAALAVRASVSLLRLPTSTDDLPTTPEAADRGFIKDELLETATDLVNEGIRFRRAPAGGALYLHFKPRGFGGVLSLRYRR